MHNQSPGLILGIEKSRIFKILEMNDSRGFNIPNIHHLYADNFQS